MIKIVIIEDEIPARKKLIRFLKAQEETTEILVEIDTVEVAINFLNKNRDIDLIFSDIELLDGNAFEIYNQVSVTSPIIFTTAYDQFWMNAFENNGIDYLLKPFSSERFQKAWAKFLHLRNLGANDNSLLIKLTNLINQNNTQKSFKTRFTIHSNKGIYFLPIEKIAFFEANEGVVFAYDSSGKKHLLNESTLKEIEERIDPSEFFRINRSELVSKLHVRKIERYTKNTLSVKMLGNDRYLKTSQSSTSTFRAWIES